ncbi:MULTISPECIES: EcsC family protein [unclassified Streptomyces]|uniref:EcsC family protein n=1 Tax=unclassified Streptomyces TaxID=2593676 RepID=UPI001F1B4B82|nr:MULTISPECIES: EcsC family protein [unclassified Streptomyces]
MPEAVTKPIRRAGDAVADKAMRPALAGAAALLELVNDWAMELNDPKNVEKLARKRGFGIDALTELRDQDLKVCDRLLSRNTLRWRTTGAFEGGAMGLLAMVPVAGIPAAMTANILVVQVLSTSIAARIVTPSATTPKTPRSRNSSSPGAAVLHGAGGQGQALARDGTGGERDQEATQLVAETPPGPSPPRRS